MVVVKEMSEAF